jgi:hypothetical protein
VAKRVDQSIEEDETDVVPETVPGLFSYAWATLNEANPSLFSLPEPVKSSYKWVHTGVAGKYQDFNDLTLPA